MNSLPLGSFLFVFFFFWAFLPFFSLGDSCLIEICQFHNNSLESVPKKMKCLIQNQNQTLGNCSLSSYLEYNITNSSLFFGEFLEIESNALSLHNSTIHGKDISIKVAHLNMNDSRISADASILGGYGFNDGEKMGFGYAALGTVPPFSERMNKSLPLIGSYGLIRSDWSDEISDDEFFRGTGSLNESLGTKGGGHIRISATYFSAFNSNITASGGNQPENQENINENEPKTPTKAYEVWTTAQAAGETEMLFESTADGLRGENGDDDWSFRTGTGGLIAINSSLIEGRMISIQANGGDGKNNSLVGSGGRIITRFYKEKVTDEIDFSARGGIAFSKYQAGSGTIFICEFQTCKLVVSGSNGSDVPGIQETSPTILFLPIFSNISLFSCGNQANTKVLSGNSTRPSNNPTRPSKNQTSTNSKKRATILSSIHVSGTSYLNFTEIDFIDFNGVVKVYSDSQVIGNSFKFSKIGLASFKKTSIIQVEEVLKMIGDSGEVRLKGILRSSSRIMINGRSADLMILGSIEANDKIMLKGNNITVKGNILMRNSSCVGPISPTTQRAKLFSDGSLSVVSLQGNSSVYLEKSSVFQGPFIQINTPDFSGEGLINASGLGCSPTHSMGPCGNGVKNDYLNYCGISGGAYGSSGGLWAPLTIIPDCQVLLSRPFGSSSLDSLYSGSGGGSSIQNYKAPSADGDNDAIRGREEANGMGENLVAPLKSETFIPPLLLGFGGGIIHINASNTIKISGTIHSEGVRAGVSMNNKFAGGSGGSIRFDTTKLTFLNDTNISIKGGGYFDLLGSGGGGRLFLKFQNVSGKANILAKSSEGDKNSGSVAISFCRPGYSGPFCTKCEVGFFKSEWGPQDCISCKDFNDLPEEKKNSKKPGSTTIEQCNWNKTRITETITLGFEFICCFLGLLFFMFGIVYVLFRRRENQKTERKRSFESGSNRPRMTDRLSIFLDDEMVNDKSYLHDGDPNSTKFFGKICPLKLQEIPYHFARIYIKGRNTPVAPWSLSLECFEKSEMNEYIDRSTVQELCKKFNAAAIWRKRMKTTLYIFKRVNYSPFFMILLKWYKSRVFRSVKGVISQNLILNSKAMNEDIQIRITLSENLSNICLDFVNKKLDLMNWSIEKKLPIVFHVVGKGSFNNPFRIDLRDPYLRALMSHFNDSVVSQKVMSKLLIHTVHKSTKRIGLFQLLALNLNIYLRSLQVITSLNQFQTTFKAFRKFLVDVNEQIFEQTNFALSLTYEKNWKKEQKDGVLIEIDLKNKRHFVEVIKDIYYTINFSESKYISLQIIFNHSDNATKGSPRFLRVFNDDLITEKEEDIILADFEKNRITSEIDGSDEEFDLNYSKKIAPTSQYLSGSMPNQQASQPVFLNPIAKLRETHLINQSILKTQNKSGNETEHESKIYIKRPRVFHSILMRLYLTVIRQLTYPIRINVPQKVKFFLFLLILFDVVDSPLSIADYSNFKKA